MATEQNFFNFNYGAVIEIDLLAKEPDGSVISSPASQVVSMLFSETRGGAAVLTVGTATGEIALTDAGTGEYLIQLSESDYSTLNEGQRYYYEIWTVLSGTELLQARGQITFKPTTGV